MQFMTVAREESGRSRACVYDAQSQFTWTMCHLRTRLLGDSVPAETKRLHSTSAMRRRARSIFRISTADNSSLGALPMTGTHLREGLEAPACGPSNLLLFTIFSTISVVDTGKLMSATMQSLVPRPTPATFLPAKAWFLKT